MAAPSSSFDQEFCLRWGTFQSHIGEYFRFLWKTKKQADATIFCQGGHRIEAHRFVLASCSGFFENVFSEVPTTSHAFVAVPGYHSDVVKAVIEFIYQGEVNVSNRKMSELFNVAQVRGLSSRGQETAVPTDAAVASENSPMVSPLEEGPSSSMVINSPPHAQSPLVKQPPQSPHMQAQSCQTTNHVLQTSSNVSRNPPTKCYSNGGGLIHLTNNSTIPVVEQPASPFSVPTAASSQQAKASPATAEEKPRLVSKLAEILTRPKAKRATTTAKADSKQEVTKKKRNRPSSSQVDVSRTTQKQEMVPLKPSEINTGSLSSSSMKTLEPEEASAPTTEKNAVASEDTSKPQEWNEEKFTTGTPTTVIRETSEDVDSVAPTLPPPQLPLLAATSSISGSTKLNSRVPCYPTDYKLMAVDMAQERGNNVAAKILGINESNFIVWIIKIRWRYSETTPEDDVHGYDH
ncbi:unnamed protein product [Cyprideis torosa]|uniref:Uncharacterized protein n=1 Tax=Cyprideis torosa TaxID=163714 RepID=A0A7R8WGA8_9CRUS|nr:unnamed protein product [Cyprideis torosa]CAG0892419.1 unnamed protein product [Cyprideis torosa]